MILPPVLRYSWWADDYSLVFTAINDATTEGTESGTIVINTLSAGDGYSVLTPDAVSLSINDPTSIVGFSETSSLSLTEGDTASVWYD